ncbi:hypothetical protein [Sphingomonas sp. RIT328]|uniref:hypothetical protein n=1 Tax=Sphingomonas sp. RIT328 TaxID=1470591 RepID=UPI0004487555|nr:hypothetical protein [Sphingomonas sp. RIT328]EZP55782.1 hypothetical protein BW41_00861 [Sphingomonas sp. RIT328]
MLTRRQGHRRITAGGPTHAHAHVTPDAFDAGASQARVARDRTGAWPCGPATAFGGRG